MSRTCSLKTCSWITSNSLSPSPRPFAAAHIQGDFRSGAAQPPCAVPVTLPIFDVGIVLRMMQKWQDDTTSAMVLARGPKALRTTAATSTLASPVAATSATRTSMAISCIAASRPLLAGAYPPPFIHYLLLVDCVRSATTTNNYSLLAKKPKIDCYFNALPRHPVDIITKQT